MNQPITPPPAQPPTWRVRGQTVLITPAPWLMGIVNATPDSFSDGGKFLESAAAVDQALSLVEDGASIIDIGGESTRPGADPVETDEELRRVIPVVEQLARQSKVLISIDTTKSRVAAEALAAGAHIVNDISGLSFDPEMPRVCAASGAGVVCMHIQGTPQTMQEDPRYCNVVSEVCQILKNRLDDFERCGISREQVVLDPGIGFGKTAAQNLELLSAIGELRAVGRPVCIGHSRKRFLKKLLGRPVDERLFGTIGVAIAVALQGAEIIRVHDVAPCRDALLACQAILKKSLTAEF